MEDYMMDYKPKMSSSTQSSSYGQQTGSSYWRQESTYGRLEGTYGRPITTAYDTKQSGYWVNVSEKQLMAMSSTTSLTTSSYVRKPIRTRGEPRPVAPPFWWSPKQWLKHEYLSWRFWVCIYAVLAGIVLIFHVIALGAVAGVHPFDENGRATIIEGDCGWIFRTNRYVHWFTATTSTCYLSASTYVMYCLTGPTRQEVDKAHSRNKWLDIGVLSLRNTLRVSRTRAIFFLCLGLSSPMIQFFYNAMVFMTYSANSYHAFVAKQSFLTEPNIRYNLSTNATMASALNTQFGSLIDFMHDEMVNKRLEKLTPSECIDRYAVPLQAGNGNVILITNKTLSGHPLLDYINQDTQVYDVFDVYHGMVPTEDISSSGEQYMWLCDQRTASSNTSCLYEIDNVKGNTRNWTISDGNRTVDHCLVQNVQEHCKLQVSLTMSLISIATIAFKVVIMFIVAFYINETPLMTTGDAIETFMREPDPYTQGMCMASKKMIEVNPQVWPKAPLFVRLKKWRWAHGIQTRVAFFCLSMVIALCLNAALFCTVRDAITIPNFFSLGIGTINRNFFIGWAHRSPQHFIQAVFLANVGHAVFGILYMIYNNIFYAMMFSWEWARYAHHRKGLRVSERPRGEQRGFYFWLLPWRLAMPIIAFSVGIHSLVSFTLFIVNVETASWDFDSNSFVRTPAWDFTTTGFSPLGNALLIIAGALMISHLLCCSALELKSTMPVTSTCSAAISAACHPDENEPDDCYLRKVTWGVTSVQNGIGHCTFSCLDVEKPNENTPYA